MERQMRVIDPSFFIEAWELRFAHDRQKGREPIGHDRMYHFMVDNKFMDSYTGKPLKPARKSGLFLSCYKQNELDQRISVEYQNAVNGEYSGQSNDFLAFLTMPAIEIIQNIEQNYLGHPELEDYNKAEKKLITCRLFVEKALGWEFQNRGYDLEDTELLAYCAYSLYQDMQDDYTLHDKALFLKKKYKFYCHMLTNICERADDRGRADALHAIEVIENDVKHQTISFRFEE